MVELQFPDDPFPPLEGGGQFPVQLSQQFSLHHVELVGPHGVVRMDVQDPVLQPVGLGMVGSRMAQDLRPVAFQPVEQELLPGSGGLHHFQDQEFGIFHGVSSSRPSRTR